MLRRSVERSLVSFLVCALSCAGISLGQPISGYMDDLVIDQRPSGGGLWGEVSTTAVLLDDLGFGGDFSPTFGIIDGQAEDLADAYFGFHAIAVDGTGYGPDASVTTVTTDTAGVTVGLETTDVAGLRVNLEYFFPRTQPVVRVLGTFTNDGISSESVTVRYGGLLSGLRNVVQDTSSGDDLFLLDDRWVTVDDLDNDPDRFSPVKGIVLYGPDFPVVVPSGLRVAGSSFPEEYSADYSLSLDPNETVRLLWFGTLDTSQSAAVDRMNATFDTNENMEGSGLLAGMDQATLDQVVNWAGLAEIVCPLSADTNGDCKVDWEDFILLATYWLSNV